MLGVSGLFGNGRGYGSMMGGQGWWWGGGFAWFIPLAIWSAVWTGFALWNAAKRGEKWWFIFFLLVHTAGILEILYLIFVAKTLVLPMKAKATSKSRKRSR